MLRLLFGLKSRVTRRAYAIAGVALMAIKYGIDAAVVYAASGEIYHPLKFISPLITHRLQNTSSINDVSMPVFVMAAYSLVFMWIAVSMTVRRSATAGKSPWLGLLIFVPYVNLLLMIVMALLPNAARPQWVERISPSQRMVPWALRSAMLGVLVAVLIGGAMIVVSTYTAADYGSVLFFVTPFIMGAACAFLYNHGREQTFAHTLGVSLIPILITGGGFMLIAAEGMICLAMAAPFAMAICLMGAAIGFAIARAAEAASTTPALLLVLSLPGLAGAEATLHEPIEHEVRSSIEIDAPPDVVWQNVIGFSELPPPSELEFKAGIAYPVRAHIEGSGVGAVRHCVFSTGAFVEPITRWEPPTRLSFDVAEQPPAMKHWSPLQHVHSRHIGESIRSKRGEFRLTALPGGRTRLEGSTWYELHMSPPLYWRLWSDSLIHTIHARVLRHIRDLSER